MNFEFIKVFWLQKIILVVYKSKKQFIDLIKENRFISVRGMETI